MHAIPADPGLQGREALGGRQARRTWFFVRERRETESARDHFENRVERSRRQAAEGIRLPNPAKEGIHLPVFHRDHRHDLLGQHVEAIHRDLQRFDAAGGHFCGENSLAEQVRNRLGNEPALTLLPDEMTGPSDTLERAGDIARRFDPERAGSTAPMSIPSPGTPSPTTTCAQSPLSTGLPSVARRTSSATLPWCARTWTDSSVSSPAERMLTLSGWR